MRSYSLTLLVFIILPVSGAQISGNDTSIGSDSTVLPDERVASFQAAVFVNKQFRCSAYLAGNHTVYVPASCISTCKWGLFKSYYMLWYSSETPLDSIQVLVGQTSSTTNLCSTVQVQQVIHSIVHPEFRPCSIWPDQLTNLARLTIKANKNIPGPRDPIYHTRRDDRIVPGEIMHVVGWAPDTGEAHLTLQKNLVAAQPDSLCPESFTYRTNDEVIDSVFCLGYVESVKNCTSDLGSLVYYQNPKMPGRNFVGIVTSSLNPGRECKPGGRVLVVTSAFKLMSFHIVTSWELDKVQLPSLE